MEQIREKIKGKLILISVLFTPMLGLAKPKTTAVAKGFENGLAYTKVLQGTIFEYIYYFLMMYLAWQVFEAYNSEQWKQLIKQVGLAILATTIMYGGPKILQAISGKEIDLKYKKSVIKVVNYKKNDFLKTNNLEIK